MRLKSIGILFAVALAAVSHSHVWEKLIAPGLTYRMETDTATPRIIHALRLSLGNTNVSARAELAMTKVYASNPEQGRETLSKLIERTGAIGGINADFFPFTGDPIGLMIRGGELISHPYKNRAAFAWGANRAAIAISDWRGTVRVNGAAPLPLTGINQSCNEDGIVLNGDSAGEARLKGKGRHYILKAKSGKLAAGQSLQAEVTQVYVDIEAIPIQPGNFVMTVAGTRALGMADLKPGDSVAFQFEMPGLDWEKYDQVIGGGPVLLRDGKIYIPYAEEGFGKSFAINRHPRTAMGRTANGDLWLIAIDGRQKMSDGATLEETAQILLRLGCTDAINLDGGGSTTIQLFDVVLNRPSDGGKERAISNAILFFGPKPAEPAPNSTSATNSTTGNGEVLKGAKFSVQAPEKLFTGDILTLKLLDSEGKPVPDREVLWAAQGAGWIDQGGQVTAVQPGTISVAAYTAGKKLTVTIQVEKKSGG